LRGLGRTVVGVSRSGAAGVACDLTDSGAVSELVERYRPEQVFHLAGYVTGRQDPALALEMFNHNERAVVNLLASLSRSGCGRVVLAGSIEEESEASPYGVSKRCAVMWSQYFHRQAGLPTVHVRLHLSYGPGQDGTKLIPYMIAKLLAGESPEINSGSRLCRFVYVDDVMDAFVMAGDGAGLEGKTVNVASEQMTIAAVAEKLEAICGNGARVRFGAPKREQEAPPAEWLDPEEWHWRAKTGMDEGLRKTVAWMREGQGVAH